ncbi:MAG: transglycosylase SLT domain-containing protein [Mycobacteriales bacterium]
MPAHRAGQSRHRAAPEYSERPTPRHRQPSASGRPRPIARYATALATVTVAIFIGLAQAPAVERATALAGSSAASNYSAPDQRAMLGSTAHLAIEVIAPPRLDPRIAAAHAARSARHDPRSAGRLLAATRGWTGEQWTCLDRLWWRESQWNYRAQNSSSGAYGIPQALPGSKMASEGSDWRTNPITQIRWGLGYIKGRYGSPCNAWGHSQAYGWY